MNIHDAHVLITGGSSGIGLAMAEAFLEAGAAVGICARHEDGLAAVRERHPEIRTTVCDISQPEDRIALAKWAVQALPGLNMLVNNAGLQRDIDFTHGLDPFLAGPNEIRVNLEGPIIMSGLLIPTLAANRPSAIVNVSSGLGFTPAVRMPVYSASKAGMHAWSMALRGQLAPIGIKVFEVVPPAVDTNLNPEGRAARGGFRPDVKPEAFVAAVMKQLEADEPEIGYGMTAGYAHASRAELDRAFGQMNRAWNG
jgi:uncharacterized oxidoreductase